MNIQTYLSKGQPLLFDGSMGTWFSSQPGHSSEQSEMGNLTCPEEILAIHQAYLAAGCQAIKTNTYLLSAYYAEGRTSDSDKIIKAACRIAKKAASPQGAFVFADIGPVPSSDRAFTEKIYQRQADLFLEQGITCFLVETLSSEEGIAELAGYLKARCPESFLIASFAVDAGGVTRDGLHGRELLEKTAALPGVDAVGLNCLSSPRHLLKIVQTLKLDNVLLSVMPNAGYPVVLGRRTVYQERPEYFATQVAQIAQCGVGIVGGCCGTTPAHITALAGMLRGAKSPVRIMAEAASAVHDRLPEDNRFWDKLSSGKRVIAVELDPPVDDSIDVFLEGAKTLHASGADVITLADCPIGRPRADSCLLACKLKRELGIEPLPHMTCRDRNLNATKALLLGLSMENVHNVLLVTGDPIPAADRDEVKSVFNFNSRKLARYVSGLNSEVLHTPFRIFGALNVNARNFEMQLKLAQEKEANGVSGFLTQPILSAEALENLKLARKTLHGKILGGVFPVVSHRNACFLNNEVGGMRVCDEIIALYEEKNKEESEEIAVRCSTAIIRKITPYTDGIYLMTPFKRVALIARIIAASADQGGAE